MLTNSWISSLDEVDAAEWNALRGADHPFLRHEFLSALERTGCAGADNGWAPVHRTLRDANGRLVGAMPLYLKSHSWGEFVFDFAWAQAYARHGMAYYPKLVCAVPFTPASGPRLLTGAWAGSAEDIQRQLLDGALQFARDRQLSSMHVLFPEPGQAEALRTRGWLLRRDCQFHWRNEGYADFDAFLAQFTAVKRKKVKRERRRVSEAGVSFQTLTGQQIDAALWRRIHQFHADTFLRHGHLPYLNCAFFERIGAAMPDHIVVHLAIHGREPVAAAICFRSAERLYGRYWGASEHFNSLHFETCYYQGIEYCIREGLQYFEPGTQGEHKIARGFSPVYTCSAHWLADARFKEAIGHYLEREAQSVQTYAGMVEEHTPYKQPTPEAHPSPRGDLK